MTKAEIISKLESDALFALGFAVDNNVDGVVISLNQRGFSTPTGLDEDGLKLWAYGVLKELLDTNKALCIDVISAVPYNKDIDGYTSDMLDYFMRTQAARTVTTSQRFDVNAALGGLGAALTTYTAISGSSNAMGISQAQKDAEDEARRKDEEAKRKKTTNIIIITTVSIVVIVVLVSIFKKKKS